VNWLGATRLRAGYAFDQWLPFIAAGASYGGIRLETREVAVADASEKTRLGWNVGAGLEYAVTENIAFRTEYTYHSFATKTYVVTTLGETAQNRTNIHVGSVGVSYKF
jgi:outer membrane immunogenic protein